MSGCIYDVIKKQNGERFAKSIRNYDNGIFDIPNIARIVKYAGRNAEPLMRYLIGMKNIKIIDNDKKETPFELLYRAGYRAEYADTLEKQNAIRKYFLPGEELCTFDDDERYQDYYIINAVRFDVDRIRREDFPCPRREDDYGTSVMSIQIAKKGGFISIKNRYNHSVENPDNTYGSNPDNIIEGLSASLKRYFNVDFSSALDELPGGYALFDDWIVKYNYEYRNVYFGPDFYVKWNTIYEIDKSCQIMMDYNIFNLHTKSFEKVAGRGDAFAEMFLEEIRDKKLQVRAHKKPNGIMRREIFADGMMLAATENGMITDLRMPKAYIICHGFLSRNKMLRTLEMPNAWCIGDFFLMENQSLQRVVLPQVKQVGDNFMSNNLSVEELRMPVVESVGCEFLARNERLDTLEMPRLQNASAFFLRDNISLRDLDLPMLKSVGDEFLRTNIMLENINLPNLRTAGNSFLENNNSLTVLDLPSLNKAGNCFMFSNERVKKINFPNLHEAGRYFLSSSIWAPNFIAANSVSGR